MAENKSKKLEMPKIAEEAEAKETTNGAEAATDTDGGASSFQVTLPDTGERKKEFKVVRVPTGNWGIKLEGGGQVPAVLSGQYTRHDRATRAIEQYLMSE